MVKHNQNNKVADGKSKTKENKHCKKNQGEKLHEWSEYPVNIFVSDGLNLDQGYHKWHQGTEEWSYQDVTGERQQHYVLEMWCYFAGEGKPKVPIEIAHYGTREIKSSVA